MTTGLGAPNTAQVKLLMGFSGYVWRKAIFDVPLTTPDADVMAQAVKYRNVAGKVYEGQGYSVIAVRGPEVDTQIDGEVDTDRKRYAIYMYCRKRPQTIIMRDVPDELVPEMLQYKGTKLLD